MKKCNEARWAAALFAMFAVTAACNSIGYPLGAENAKPIVMVDAERDLDCPAKDIRLEEGWGGVWVAKGCGHVQKYTANCQSVRCEVHRDDEAPVPFVDRPEPDQLPR